MDGSQIAILQENFVTVRGEVRTAFDGWGDPLEETVDLITQRYSQKMSQEEAQERAALIRAVSEIALKSQST